MNEKKYSLEQIVELSGISQRNVKFWCAAYNIKPKKIGRNNFYSEKQFQLLKLVKYLSDTCYFSQKFIKLIIDMNQNFVSVEPHLKTFISEIKNIFRSSSELLPVSFSFSNTNEETITDDGLNASGIKQSILSNDVPVKNNNQTYISESALIKEHTSEVRVKKQDSFLL